MMRSILMTALCMLVCGLFTSNLSAQETTMEVIPQTEAATKTCGHNHNEAYRIGLNLETGMNRLTNLQDLDVQSTGTGFGAGLVYERFLIGKTLALSTGANFSNRSMTYDSEITDDTKSLDNTRTVEITNQGSFVEIPVGIRYRAPLVKTGMKPFLQAGIVNQFLIDGNTIEKIAEKGTQEQLPSDLNKYNIGLTIGAGMEFALGCRTFSAGLQMKKGMKAVKTTELYQMNTYGIQFGYYF